MKKNANKINLSLDISVFIAFLSSFWLDLTGLSLHQWLGVSIAAVVLLHIVLHWNWVKSVTQRFFSRTSNQARLYYLVDALLLFDFVLILASGLLISTWFSIPLVQPALWVNLHILISILSLVLLMVKIGLHWRWITRNMQKLFVIPVFQEKKTLVFQPVTANVNYERRAFLKLMGVSGAAALISITGVLIPDVQDDEAFAASLTTADAVTTAPTAQSETATSTAQTQATNRPAAQATTQPAATPTEAPATQVAQAELQPTPSTPVQQAAAAGSTCQVRCNRRCSYPGHCRKYTDSNANGRCDWGECL